MTFAPVSEIVKGELPFQDLYPERILNDVSNGVKLGFTPHKGLSRNCRWSLDWRHASGNEAIVALPSSNPRAVAVLSVIIRLLFYLLRPVSTK